MFGSCGNNLRCGLGEVGIADITVIRVEKDVIPQVHGDFVYTVDRESYLNLSDVRLLRNVSFSSSRDLSSIIYDRGMTIITTNEPFSPETISLQVKYLQDIDRVKSFMRDSNSTYTLKIDFRNKTVYCDVILQSETVDTYTIVNTWTIDLLRTSMFYKKTVYPKSGGGENYLIIYNSGDVPGALQFSGSSTDTSPVLVEIRFRWDKAYTHYEVIDPFNRYSQNIQDSSGLDIPYIRYSSVPGNIYIEQYGYSSLRPGQGWFDISNERDFTTKGFVTVPKGQSRMEILGLYDYEVIVYEYYYNI